LVKLDIADTENDTWFLGVYRSADTTRCYWYFVGDSAGDDSQSVQYVLGTGWDLITYSSNTVDLISELGFSLGKEKIAPTELELSVNSTSIFNNTITPTDNSGFYYSTTQFSGNNGILQYDFSSPWNNYTFQIDNQQINFTKSDLVVTQNFTIEEGNQVDWNVTINISEFESGFIGNLINISIPKSWVVNELTVDSEPITSYNTISGLTENIVQVMGSDADNGIWNLYAEMLIPNEEIYSSSKNPSSTLPTNITFDNLGFALDSASTINDTWFISIYYLGDSTYFYYVSDSIYNTDNNYESVVLKRYGTSPNYWWDIYNASVSGNIFGIDIISRYTSTKKEVFSLTQSNLIINGTNLLSEDYNSGIFNVLNHIESNGIITFVSNCNWNNYSLDITEIILNYTKIITDVNLSIEVIGDNLANIEYTFNITEFREELITNELVINIPNTYSINDILYNNNSISYTINENQIIYYDSNAQNGNYILKGLYYYES
jgi:hypothetical protein